MPRSVPSLVAAVRRRVGRDYERRTTMPRHRYKVDLRFRDAIWWRIAAGLAVVAALALLIRWPLVGWSWPVAAIAAAVVVVSRTALLDPPLPPHAHGLAGVTPPAECPEGPLDRHRWVLAVRWSSGAVLLAIAGAAPTLVVVVLAVVLLGIAAPVLLARIEVWAARRRLRRALRALRPRWALVYGGLAGGPTHMTMWEPYLRASGEPGVVINLRSQYCSQLRTGSAMPEPWIQLGSDQLGDLRRVAVRSIGAFFHVHNAPIHLVLFGVRWVRHVWLGHGDSDKPGSRHRRHLNFDLLAVSGQAAIDRYLHHGVPIPPERFVVIGRPQVSEIVPATAPIDQLDRRPRVLYAPTWHKRHVEMNFSSIRLAPAIVRALIAAGVDVVFRPHPVFLSAGREDLLRPVYRVLQHDTDDPATVGRHVWGDVPNVEWSIFDCMNHSDALLSDVSSVVSDWLQSTKPYAIVSMRHSLDEFGSAVPVARGGYVVAADLGNLSAVLDELLHRDPLAAERAALKQHVLGPFEGRESADAFAELVRELGTGTWDGTSPAEMVRRGMLSESSTLSTP